MQYVYDGLGRRVEKTVDGVTTLALRTALGEVADEVSGTTWTDSILVPGAERVALVRGSANGSPGTAAAVTWLHSDQVGTTRLLTDQSGNNLVQCNQNSYYAQGGLLTYAPFGAELDCTQAQTDFKFTGKERDAESGLDYFGARYYGSTTGRFMSPDPVFISAQRLMDPQSLNLYSYVRNNSPGLTDDTGLDFYLACQTSDHSGCGQVQNGSSSVWVQGQGSGKDFVATDVDMNKQGDASAGYHDQFGNQYTGTFDRNNGVSFTNTATGATSGGSQFIDGSDPTQLSGSGAFTNITGNFFSDCGGSCQGRAALSGTADAFAATESQLNKQVGLLTFLDRFSRAHTEGAQWKDSNGYAHMLQDPGGRMEMHFEGHPTGVDAQQFVLHMVDTIRDAASGRANQEKNTPLP